MANHISDELIARYKELLPAELLAIDDHVIDCDLCQSRLRKTYETPFTSLSLKNNLLSAESLHLSYHQIESYVDQILDITDQEIVNSHISLCELCNELVKDLQSAAAEVIKIQQQSASWKDKVLFLWNSQEYSAAFRTISYAAILMFFALVLSLLINPQQGLQTKLEQSIEKNKQLELELSSLKEKRQQIDWQNVGSFPESYQQIARLALANERVAIPALVQELQGNQKILMGEQREGFEVFNPVGVVVEQTQPDFNWESIRDATYVIQIYDTSYNLVNSSPVLRKTSWKPIEPLDRGKTYVWKVTAKVSDQEFRAPVPPAPEAKFMILEENKLKELDALRAKYADSYFLLGLAYTDYGLINEAVLEFKKLKDENPDSKLAERLLDSIQDYKQKDSSTADPRSK